MNAFESRIARESLGLTREQLAADTNTTPAAVAAWEEDRIGVPRHIATSLRWRGAIHERQAALADSGLPTCAWMDAFEKEPEPTDIDERSSRHDRLLDHVKACKLCAAREAFVSERFPPMPPAPRPGLLGVVVPIAERIQTLPRWAQAPTIGAILFVAYSLFKLLLLLPSFARRGVAGLLTAAEGIAASAALGALAGFLYDLYRRRRDAAASPDKKAALETLDAEMADLRARGIGGGALRDVYLRQRRAILKGKLTASDLQLSRDDSVPEPPNEH